MVLLILAYRSAGLKFADWVGDPLLIPRLLYVEKSLHLK